MLQYVRNLPRVALLLAGAACLAAPPAPAAPTRGGQAPKPAGGKLVDKHFPEGGQVVFAVRAQGKDPHWYANFGYWCSDPQRKMYGPGGALLCRLDLASGKVTRLIDDPAGSVRDPAVHYDGRTVLVSYRPGGSIHFNLYELDAAGDGSKRTRVTDGEWDDIEPCYLPDGDIVFCSARCNRWVNCWHTQVAILYRSERDGSNARPISSNIEHDNTPAVLPDGRILYTRWEYVDRSQVDFHHLWTINPDGTRQMAYFGNMRPKQLFIDAVPLPGGDGRIAAIFCPGHGRREHVGDLHVVRPDAGPDALGQAEAVPGCPRNVRDPDPVTDEVFFVARKRQLLLVDAAAGAHEVVYELPGALAKRGLELHEPRLLRPRPRERVIPDSVDPARPTGRLALADVARGRRMDGVRDGEITELLVLESLPKPVNFSGGPEPVSYLGTFTLERVLGTVPVEPDGSAYFELPANRPVFFVALDANGRSVKRMHSFTSVMPGETTGCVGCHERRTTSIEPAGDLAALSRGPSRIQPFEGYPDVLDFPRDVQPILDKHCLECHDYPQRAGGVVLSGDDGVRYGHAYFSLLAHGQIVDGRNAVGNRPPRSVGSSASPLLEKLDGTHHDVKLSEREKRILWLWVESGAPYAGTYASLGCGLTWINYWHACRDVMERRCRQCHAPPPHPRRRKKDSNGKIYLPAARHPRRPGGVNHERWVGKYRPAATRSAHLITNLTRPEMSSMLLAPLARKAGGWGRLKNDPTARDGRHPIVFTSKKDPDYRKMLGVIRSVKTRLDEMKRFHMPGFRPNEHYVREMKRYGILPNSYDPHQTAIDVYETDRAYWRSFWYTPTGE